MQRTELLRIHQTVLEMKHLKHELKFSGLLSAPTPPPEVVTSLLNLVFIILTYVSIFLPYMYVLIKIY